MEFNSGGFGGGQSNNVFGTNAKPNFSFGNGNSSKTNEDDDELYGGFNYNDGTSINDSLSFGAPSNSNFSFGNIAGGGGSNPYAAPPSTAFRGAPPGTSMNRNIMTVRMGTSAGVGLGGEARPLTSVKGAGFSTVAAKPRVTFDPLNQGTTRGPAPPLAEKSGNSPEDAAKEMERNVHKLLEESAKAISTKDLLQGLERAKEAVKKERLLCKHRESNGLVDQINLDLTYSVCFNLANTYCLNNMYPEALSTYSLIVKNKQYPQSGRLRVNMGNIYYQQKNYPMAVKMYRMALDQIPNTIKDTRHKISKNIGSALVKMGRFQEAITSFENIMDGVPDVQSGFNLIVCYFALGDTEKMKKGFLNLISVPMEGASVDIEESKESEDHTHTPPDSLTEELRVRTKEAIYLIVTAATLIAPVLYPNDWVTGYNWIIESLSQDHLSIANEMEISKANMYLKHNNFSQAVEVLKRFEKKDQSLKARAATNLSFLYFLEGDIKAADKYASLAVKHDRYSAKALVNKGNCLFRSGEYERAKELYLEAIGVEADCVEAIYNLGLVNKQMGIFSEALQAFEKLHSIVPNAPEVIYQIASIHDHTENFRNATKWFNILISRVPSDPEALARLGQIFNRDGDETQAFHYHLESYQHLPINLEVVSWLGVWYVKSGLFEKAIQFFERATEIQPKEVKWQLMVTSCYRRMGNYQKALELYKSINKDHPDNLECLRYLVAICKDLGMKYDSYQGALMKLERANNAKTRMNAGGGTTFAQLGATSVGDRGGPGNQRPPVITEIFEPSEAGGHSRGATHTAEAAAGGAARRSMSGGTSTSAGKKKSGNLMKNKQAKKLEETDEFEDADLDDLLAD